MAAAALLGPGQQGTSKHYAGGSRLSFRPSRLLQRPFHPSKHDYTSEMVVSQNKGTQYRPQNTIVLIIGTPKMVPLILGNPQIYLHDVAKLASLCNSAYIGVKIRIMEKKMEATI